jgi:hypothetical protein
VGGHRLSLTAKLSRNGCCVPVIAGQVSQQQLQLRILTRQRARETVTSMDSTGNSNPHTGTETQ